MALNESNAHASGHLPYGLGGNSIVPKAQNLYVEYTEPQEYQGTPITIDILAYPSN